MRRSSKPVKITTRSSKVTYKDPIVEEVLLELFKMEDDSQLGRIEQFLAGKDGDKEIEQKFVKWGVLYHLSPLRHNLLNWYPFDADGELFEIGAGCGALTGVLAERVRTVTANELTESRAAIIRERHKDKGNIIVEQGNIIDSKLHSRRYDYVTAIGVLEYSGKFINVDGGGFFAPYVEFLKKAKSLLKSDGVLLIAIENKLGLKYLSGGYEDHYAKLGESLDNYPHYEGVATFTKFEICNLLVDAGFKADRINFYYPFPDYKLPTVVYSEEYLAMNTQPLNSMMYSIDPYLGTYEFFDEAIFAQALAKESILSTFANSFLIEIRN